MTNTLPVARGSLVIPAPRHFTNNGTAIPGSCEASDARCVSVRGRQSLFPGPQVALKKAWLAAGSARDSASRGFDRTVRARITFPRCVLGAGTGSSTVGEIFSSVAWVTPGQLGSHVSGCPKLFGVPA